jgi:hypothetical protein
MIRVRAVVILAIVMQVASCSSGTDTAARARETVAIPDVVREELVRLGIEDQRPRQGLTPEKLQDTLLLRDMIRGDSTRTARLKVIVAEYGWPDSARVGSAASGAAFLILQHSPDHDFQKKMVPTLEELAGMRAIPPDEVAMLIDRVLMHDNLPQRYGTQFNMVDGRWVLHPVENEAMLDEMREKMGLPPLDEYMRMMEEFYKAPVVRKQ